MSRNKLNRMKMEMAIQIYQMEAHKWLVSERCNCDAGSEAYLEWVRQHSQHCRDWLDSLTDEELEEEYRKISPGIRKRIERA